MMLRKVHIFNPEHDLALANADANFNAPLSAQKLAADLSVVPLWYCGEGSIVLVDDASKQWVSEQQAKFPQIASIVTDISLAEKSLLHAAPWGWDKAIRKRLSQLGLPAVDLPSDTDLQNVYELSHRRQAILLHNYLKQNVRNKDLFPDEASEIFTFEALEKFVVQCPEAILKAPYSGSGKGICWVTQVLDKSKSGWATNILSNQGSLIAEKVYANLQDFALLFDCQNGDVRFVGYSLFETDNGIYRGNALLSNEQIVLKIHSLGISLEDLQEIQLLTCSFVAKQIAPHYAGVVGVDMFLYNDMGVTKLHPSVEINLRMTMGMLARAFYDRFVVSTSVGQMYIDYAAKPHKLLQDHASRISNFPLQLDCNRIVSGYFCASAINEYSQYRLRVEVSSGSFE